MGLSDITGIRLKGANFEEETQLQVLVTDKEPALGLVYGKNGTGKSTISRAFAKVSGKTEDTIESASVINGAGADIALSDNERQTIHVFNEQYIDANIKFRPDGKGLETIVVLGKANDIEKDLAAAQKAVDEQNAKVESQKKIKESLEDEKNESSPLFHLKKIREALKGEEAWSGRDAKIRGNSRASSTREDTYLRFVSRKPTKKRDELVAEFATKLISLNEAKSGIKRIEKSVEVVKYERIDFDDKKYLSLLGRKIEKPELSEREQFLLAIQASWGQEHPQKIRYYFSEESHRRCPYCLQIVDEQYKAELFRSIERVLSKAAEEHIDELKKCFLQTITFDYSPYQELDKNVLENSQQCLEQVNAAIDDVNRKLKQKMDNVYVPISENDCNLKVLYDAFIVSLVKLENTRIEYNRNASDTNSIIADLIEINSDISYYDIIDKYKVYEKLLLVANAELKKISKLEAELERLTKILQGYKDKKRDVQIALRQINKDLNYIFFAKGRLKIEMDGDQYLVKSRGKAVSPSKISVGERNAIALCYFFSEIMREQNEGEIYSKQYCLIIDDPVSSFDMENRIGILSFLKYQFNKFVSGNKKTKIVLLTHDIQTVYDVEKIYGEITDLYGIQQRDRKNYIKVQELVNNGLVRFESSKRNEYSLLMVNIYKYVKGMNLEYELVVGNSMRRIMEAYGSFMYKKGIDKLSTDPEIKEILKEPFAGHFENLMYRLVLHGGSHNEERVRSMVSDDFFDYISSEEKIRTAKEILVFLYSLDEKHVLEHLKTDTDGVILVDAHADLELWKNEILDMISVGE